MTGERQIQGVPFPSFLYGTAWKEQETAKLTSLALASGFRGIDTANQRKHYCEAAAGEAVAKAQQAGSLSRDEVFLQTKFTYQSGQDHRLPYEADASLDEQVAQSFASSLEHLHTDYIDSYVLHGPMYRGRLCDADVTVWHAMETLHAEGRAKLLGVSNVDLPQLRALTAMSAVRPAFVQNRCFAKTGWDRDIRHFCSNNGMVYQGFSLLTANRAALIHPAMDQLARRLDRSPAQLVFRFAIERGMLPLTGTRSADHMAQDLACENFEVSAKELDRIETLLL